MRECNTVENNARLPLAPQIALRPLNRSIGLKLVASSAFAFGFAAVLLGSSAAAAVSFAQNTTSPASVAEQQSAQTAEQSASTSREQETTREDRDSDGRDGEPPDAPRRDRASRGGRSGGALPPDWPRAGGFGGRDRPFLDGLVADEFLSDLARRELTDEELARAIRIASRVSEEWGKTLATRAEQDPIQLKAAMRSTGRRILALMSLEERSPSLFEAKIAELRAQGETARAGEALRRAEDRMREAGEEAPQTAEAEAELTALRAALDATVAKQVAATLVVRREEIRAVEARLARANEEVERDAADSSKLVEEIRARALAPRDARTGGEGGARESRGEPRGESRGETRGESRGEPRGEPRSE
jgi:hypothetical protein